jgi:hypothetical protein
LSFANAVGGCHYVNDGIMGDWLGSRLDQDVANEAECGLGLDVSRTPIYRPCSAKVLYAYLQTSVFADQFSDHHFNKAMQRSQMVGKSPLVYVRAIQNIPYSLFLHLVLLVSSIFVHRFLKASPRTSLKVCLLDIKGLRR